MAVKKNSKKVKTVNAKELKAWLRGIQEFQPAGWVPSVEQWDAIRERIFLLDEVEAYADAGGYQTQTVYVEEPRYNPSPAFAAPAQVYTAVPANGSLSSLPSNQGEPHRAGALATASSPTDTGVVSVTSANEVIEHGSKSPFS